ncbi:low molecular weight protein arginine phosphatase [Neobacillus thermocopriae]|uniref:Low molecular weight protein arginine phosphatase n=1 Tax=Neobacillus thermocopriae TaxID=1215031 RepID=A0A6B3TRB5_9BACI|nr:low molecular weight protein arginine phosphatase [Neobacillus thermocopriae]MED3623857.1 low molecular weight protein arginine phosphatase [Neobacillus thermocopriae]MED3713313.1 low molecular weight protein arginine phosphatase [Neobacillus thermocopriae]NEX78247.1 low molecular weight protein arginine phosphatase [Neobacillus thermocopriae]
MQRILFVCTGNTCRSPMAEAILKHKNLEGIEVKSAGIYASGGSEASPNAKLVLDKNQISHNHRSTLLSEKEVNWADLILTMTSSHKYAIQQQYPQAIEKVYTLKEFIGEERDQDVVDPYGGSLAIYEQTFQELQQLIDKAIEKLKPNTGELS